MFPIALQGQIFFSGHTKPTCSDTCKRVHASALPPDHHVVCGQTSAWPPTPRLPALEAARLPGLGEAVVICWLTLDGAFLLIGRL